MTLSQKQQLFCKMSSELILWIFTQHDCAVTYGEATRSKLQAEANAASGAGISNSNHLIRLALDLNLFINGVYQTASESYRFIGDKWKSMSTEEVTCCWGGDFSKPDGNHISFLHNGVR